MSSWDNYFLRICKEVASNSKCLSRKIGSLIVRDKFIIATGYNSPPMNTKHCDERYDPVHSVLGENICPRKKRGYESGQGLHLCVASHSEANSIACAARNGTSTIGCILYINGPLPCKSCAALIINAGIIEVVTESLIEYDDLGLTLLHEAGILVRSVL